LEPTSFLQIRPIIDKGQPNFLHLRTFGDKGPIIFTDKAFLQIRASHTYAQNLARIASQLNLAGETI